MGTRAGGPLPGAGALRACACPVCCAACCSAKHAMPCTPGSCTPNSCTPGSCTPNSCPPGSCTPGRCLRSKARGGGGLDAAVLGPVPGLLLSPAPAPSSLPPYCLGTCCGAAPRVRAWLAWPAVVAAACGSCASGTRVPVKRGEHWQRWSPWECALAALVAASVPLISLLLSTHQAAVLFISAHCNAHLDQHPCDAPLLSRLGGEAAGSAHQRLRVLNRLLLERGTVLRAAFPRKGGQLLRRPPWMPASCLAAFTGGQALRRL